LAWLNALTDLGYETTIYPLRSVGTGVTEQSAVRRLKKSLIPMPLQGALPSLPDAELNLITVPSVFASASRLLPQSTLLFDWMDLWSVNARTMAMSSPWLLPGGIAQSLSWRALESKLPRRPAGNAFAGYSDYQSLADGQSAPSAWLPTPVEWPQTAAAKSTRFRRIGFLGNMNYPPNVMSLKRFLEKYAGRLASLDMELVVAGYGSEIVRSWSPSATVLGPVDKVADFYSTVDAVIVPIDHGGGIKVKAVEAMVHGVPVFGTDHVRDGFDQSFWPYIGAVDALMNSGATDLLPAPTEAMESRFSKSSFENGVAELLARSGLRSS
jgi:hypothetical protein